MDEAGSTPATGIFFDGDKLMTQSEKILLALIEALEWKDRTMQGGMEHERTIAAQKVAMLQKFAREVFDEITE